MHHAMPLRGGRLLGSSHLSAALEPRLPWGPGRVFFAASGEACAALFFLTRGFLKKLRSVNSLGSRCLQMTQAAKDIN